jgi:hypothetical protein
VNRTQRLVFIAALVFIASGVVFGFIHAWSVNHGTLLVLREQYKDGWLATATQASNPPEDPLSRAKQMNYRYVRVVDAHTHIIKLGTVLLLVGLVQPLVALPDKRKRALAAMFIVGSCIFPIAVLAETSIKGRVPQIFAAFGALLVIVSFAGFVYGLLLGTSSQPSART